MFHVFYELGYDLLRRELERYGIEWRKLVLDDLTAKKRLTRRQPLQHVSAKLDGLKSDNPIAHSTLSADEHQATESTDAGLSAEQDQNLSSLMEGDDEDDDPFEFEYNHVDALQVQQDDVAPLESEIAVSFINENSAATPTVIQSPSAPPSAISFTNVPNIDDTPITELSLLELGILAVMNRQRGRFTKFNANLKWEIYRRGVSNSYDVFINKRHVRGMQMIDDSSEIDKSDRRGICILGCMKDGKRQWINSYVYITFS
jgi:hypothetical protein